MDLIYMNNNHEDVDVLHEYNLDLAFGADENDFECTLNLEQHCCQEGYFLYFENTEYGGRIDSIYMDSAAGEVKYSGATWHGILESKVLKPDAGENYLVLSGEANAVLNTLIKRMSLQELFSASEEDSGIIIKNYQMNRYVEGYTGIRKMLKAFGAKLSISFELGIVRLAAAQITDYTKDNQFDSDTVPLKVKKNYRAVNHLICLGKGELAERTVIHLYADKDGNISRTQSLFGLDEVERKLDYPSVESEEDLISKGMEELKKLQNKSEVNIDFTSDEESYDIGDIVGAKDHLTDLEVSTEITKKIVSVQNGVTKISYKVGE